MDGAETTLYPRYLSSNLPREGNAACVAGQVVDVSENNVLTLDCDPESKLWHIQTNNRSLLKSLAI